jgi:hypothetical protein
MRIQVTTRGLWLVLLFALGASPASAACINPALAPEAINQFRANPQGLIPSPETDVRTVEAMTRDLAGTDSSLAPALITIAKSASPRFQSAIAAGLAQAALTCLSVDQKAALEIQQAAASFEDGQFQSLFAAVVGDLSTAATAAAESAATSSVGSVIIVNPNSSPGTKTAFGGGGSTPPPTTPAVTAPVFAAAGPSLPNTNGNTSSSPVSASR